MVQWLCNLSILCGCLALAAKPVGVTRQQDVLQQSSHLFESDAISNLGQSVILGHCSLNNINLYKTKY